MSISVVELYSNPIAGISNVYETYPVKVIKEEGYSINLTFDLLRKFPAIEDLEQEINRKKERLKEFFEYLRDRYNNGKMGISDIKEELIYGFALKELMIPYYDSLRSKLLSEIEMNMGISVVEGREYKPYPYLSLGFVAGLINLPVDNLEQLTKEKLDELEEKAKKVQTGVLMRVEVEVEGKEGIDNKLYEKEVKVSLEELIKLMKYNLFKLDHQDEIIQKYFPEINYEKKKAGERTFEYIVRRPVWFVEIEPFTGDNFLRKEFIDKVKNQEIEFFGKKVKPVVEVVGEFDEIGRAKVVIRDGTTHWIGIDEYISDTAKELKEEIERIKSVDELKEIEKKMNEIIDKIGEFSYSYLTECQPFRIQRSNQMRMP